MACPGRAPMKISMPRTSGDWFIFIIRLLIGLIFIYASIDKIIHPGAFAKIIHNYRLLPPEYINILALVLPWLEAITGICLIFGIKYKAANLIILTMLVVFIIALSINLVRGVNISCGCFSTSGSVKSNLLWRIIEDALMLIGCLIIMFKDKLQLSIQLILARFTQKYNFNIWR